MEELECVFVHKEKHCIRRQKSDLVDDESFVESPDSLMLKGRLHTFRDSSEYFPFISGRSDL